MDGKNKMLNKELANSREQEKKVKAELADMTNRYNENKYEIEVLYEDNSRADKQFQIAQEAATERIKGMKNDFRINIEEIHEDYIMRIENAKIKSDMEVDKL